MNTEKEFFTLLYAKKYEKQYDKKLLFYQLKNNFTYDEQVRILKKVPRLFDTLIYNKPIIKEYKDFGKQDKGVVSSVNIELKWLVHLFTKYSNEINEFLKLKNKFEKSFLLGDYTVSAATLSEIKKISISYWGLENKFLQVQNEKGLEFNINLLNKLNSLDIPDPKFLALTYFFSNKVEEDVSYISFYSRLTSLLNQIKSTDYHKYFRYRLLSMNYNYSEEDNEVILWYNSNLSIIDQYLTFKDIIIHLLTKSDNEESVALINQISNSLKVHIEDDFFKRVNIFTEESLNYTIDIKELEIIDAFYRGDYKNVIFDSKKYLLENPSNFSVIKLYIKSHLLLFIDIQLINDTECVLNNILILTYNLLAKSKKANEIYSDFLTLVNSITCFDISKEILAFVEMNLSSDIYNNPNNNTLLYNNIVLPDTNILFEKTTQRLKYLEFLRNSNLKTAEFIIDVLKGVDNIEEKYHSIIPQHNISYYIALELFKKDDIAKCMIYLENDFHLTTQILFLKELYIILLYECYVKTGNYDKALNLYVDNYLINENLVTKIKTKILADIIVNNRWRNVDNSNINMPIFIHLSNSEVHSKFISYDLYMRSKGINLPSQLFSETDNLSQNGIYFLKNVANQKVISRKALVFKTSNDVQKERILICQLLSKTDKKNIEIYNKEISEITQRLTVQQRIKEIDQSKIYVDERGLFESELDDVRKDFNRFRSISDLLKSKKVDSIGFGLNTLYDQYSKEEINIDVYKKLRTKSDLHFDLFVNLYISIRDKFLFSNQYGLDYYLSQRIRHGTIIGQLRKQFKELNLVTTKSTVDNNYLPNKFWSEKLFQSSDSSRIVFENRMSEFSDAVDTIINDLKDKYIQIKTEDSKTKQTGWFDFKYIPLWHYENLYVYYIGLNQIEDFEEFTKLIFEGCWNDTEIILEQIRNNLDALIKGEFISQLDKLEFDLKSIISSKNSNAINRAISECRTNIQSDVDYVKRWFNRSKNDEIDFTLIDAYNTSYTIVNNIVSPSLMLVSENVNSDVLIKGIYFPHFVDLMKILLTNIYDYYKKNDMLNNYSDVSININGAILILSFKNQISNDTDIDFLKEKIEKIQIELDSKSSIKIRREDNTGIIKANNILKYVFRNLSNNLSFVITQQTFEVKCEINLNNLIV